MAGCEIVTQTVFKCLQGGICDKHSDIDSELDDLTGAGLTWRI